MQKFTSSMLILFVFLIIPVASFSQNKGPALQKLTKKADLILTGKVTKKSSAWNANKTRIYTKTTLKVDEFIKGKRNESSLEVTYPGGEVGEVGELYTHMPKFSENEEVLVFLKQDHRKNEFKILNGEEGKFTVLRDSGNNRKVVPSNIRMDDLKSQIKSILNEKQ